MSSEHRFDPGCSELASDSEKLAHLVAEIEKRLGHGAKIVGVLEIGSFTKDEAVPTSDSDLRIYVESPDVYFWQGWGADRKATGKPEKEQYFLSFLETSPDLPRVTYEWEEFNEPISHELSESLGINFEFGIADARFVRHQFDNLRLKPCGEYELLFQGKVLYDPLKILADWYSRYYGARCQTLCDHYQVRYLDHPPFEVALHTKPDRFDRHKIEKSGQILWVKWAVRALRDAVASKTYQATGKFTYRKQEVLDFYRKHLPQHMDFIELLYIWKTDETVRAKMVQEFLDDPNPFFDEFASMMPKLESIVADVNRLEL